MLDCLLATVAAKWRLVVGKAHLSGFFGNWLHTFLTSTTQSGVRACAVSLKRVRATSHCGVFYGVACAFISYLLLRVGLAYCIAVQRSAFSLKCFHLVFFTLFCVNRPRCFCSCYSPALPPVELSHWANASSKVPLLTCHLSSKNSFVSEIALFSPRVRIIFYYLLLPATSCHPRFLFIRLRHHSAEVRITIAVA